MKRISLVLFLASITFCSSAQTTTLDLEAYFSAVIVDDLESSIDWYAEVLGFEVISKVELEERGIKQSNLKRGSILLELIELESAVAIKEVVPNYTNKTRTIGLFKTGFLVSDFDKWIDHFNNKEVNFHGNVVTDTNTGKRMVIIADPDANRIQIFEK